MKEEYSPYKVIHHLDKIEQLKNGEQTIPLQVHIVPSDVCNQNCSFCSYRMDGYLSNQNFTAKEILPYEKMIEILNSLKSMGIKAVQYTGGGEPLVHPKIYDIFKHSLNLNFDMALVSNGMALTEKICDLLGDSSWTRISLDASSDKMYSFLRKVKQGTFDKTIANISNLVKHRRKCILGVGFVVQKENYREVLDAAKLCKELGVNNFRISAAFTTMGYDYFASFEEEAKSICAQAKEEFEDENFTIFNLFNDRVKDTFEGIQDYNFCPIKELQIYIGADCKVYTCCTLAYNDKGEIGSLKNQTFEELWFGEKKKVMYENHNPSKHCQFPCMYKGKNEFINYCIKKDPLHTNFI